MSAVRSSVSGFAWARTVERHEAGAQSQDRESRILVTQPRRIAATSLARRVAAHRGVALGSEVGYKIGGPRVKAMASPTGFSQLKPKVSSPGLGHRSPVLGHIGDILLSPQLKDGYTRLAASTSTGVG